MRRCLALLFLLCAAGCAPYYANLARTFGVTAGRVVELAPCPVLVVKDRREQPD